MSASGNVWDELVQKVQMISRRQMLLLGGAAAIPWPGQAQEKPKAPHYALIIGNAAYSDGIGPLENSVNDALLVADAIRNCRFELVTGDVVRDADRSTMLSSLREYVNLMEAGGPDALGFLYYAGHGAAHEDRGNFLIPVQDAAQLDDALWDDSVSLESVMNRLAKLEAPSVVAIDACRNVLRLPAAQRALGGGESFRGLRRSAGGAAERNMFLSFATWEGEPASDGFADEKNGPYATSLATRLTAPPVTVRDMFEQVRVDVLDRTFQVQEPMNLSRLRRRSIDISIGSEDQAYDPELVWKWHPNLRHALVLSNSYSGMKGLARRGADADGRTVAKALEASGYKTNQVRNAGLSDVRTALEDFSASLDKAGPASVGVLYISGYATMVDGEAYLIPDGWLPETEADVRYGSIPFGDLVSQLEGSVAQGLVIVFDCAPFVLPGEAAGSAPALKRYLGGKKVGVVYGPGVAAASAVGASGSQFADAFAREIRSADRVSIATVMARVAAEIQKRPSEGQAVWFGTPSALPVFFRANADIEPA